MTVSAPTASTAQRQRHAHNNQGAALTRSKPSLDELLLRLTGMPGGKLNAVVSHARWWLPLLIGVVAAVVRFWNLSHPSSLIFDETYYVKDAYSLLNYGYEREWPKDINDAFVNGTATPNDNPSYVVHPPLGKWIMALGMAIFGTDSGFGWRAAAAFAGTLAAVFTTMAATRLFRSAVWGGLAGLFVALDGQQIALSRTGILDIFYFMFITIVAWFVLVDRDHGRRKLAYALAGGSSASSAAGSHGTLYGGMGPRLWSRPWQLGVGISLGALCAVKWSGITFVAVFGLLIVWWDCQARRTAGIERWLTGGILHNGIPAFIRVVPVAALTYLATWIPWMLEPRAWGHGLAAREGASWVKIFPGSLADLITYHGKAYAFHTGLTKDHGWASNPWTWLVAGRPTLFKWDTTKRDGVPCETGRNCVQVVTDLPNPILWWAGTISILIVLWAFLARRDWAALMILAGVVAGYIPWLFYPERTMFFFYTTGFQLSWILAVVYALRMLAPPAGTAPRQAKIRTAAVAGIVLIILLVSAFFLPIVTGQTLFSEEIQWRIWLPSWT
ncbi:phospholipid carrier-dependent glycosyltransferase [Pseudoglutamicibacter cumminsii]|uniref:dolichyl-phosphate-mannose--protein mannosyltransferase n=1 Tax=Pseudoglutamicibacter cumminsii TaxID=156979 RepID=UPI0025523DD7|nr:phospholipid carrier-dependent glycosyltransferase [Pseudoglutamicibacter cumminsii]MDZ3746115.1 phospholipid carrier-dependent glycosyltransferase [Pseudoglutamicibacter cumminsii]